MVTDKLKVGTYVMAARCWRPWNSKYCMLSYLTFDHTGPLDTGTNNVYIINLFVYARVQFS